MLRKIQRKSLEGFLQQGWLLILFLLLGSALAAQEVEGPPMEAQETEQSNEKTTEKKTLEQRLIQSNISIAEWFDSTAEGIDLFLAGKKVTNKKNESHFRIENSTFSIEEENLRNTSSLSVILRLPNVEEYWQLKFSSYDEAEEKRNVQKSYLRNTPRERNYGASLGLFRKLGSVRTAFQPRIDLSDPLQVSHSLTFESVADFTSFSLNPKFELFAVPDKGTGFFMAMNANFSLSPQFSFTLINNGEYEDRKHQFSTGNGFAIGQVIDSRSSLSYSLIFNSNNRDNYHLESYGLAVAWNHMIYRRILDCQLVPHLDFAKTKDFKGVSGITFTLNLNF
jgi:hypothetical protein